MAAESKGVINCRFYTIVGKLFFNCEKCDTRWWTTESGRFQCTKCLQWMVIAAKEIKKKRKPAKSVLFFNNSSTWKRAINKYLEV